MYAHTFIILDISTNGSQNILMCLPIIVHQHIIVEYRYQRISYTYRMFLSVSKFSFWHW